MFLLSQIADMDQAQFPESYKTNTLKEELVTAFVDNFRCPYPTYLYAPIQFILFQPPHLAPPSS